MPETIYQGKAKDIRTWDNDPDLVVQAFRDSATAFNGEKKAELKSKGEINNAISTLLFQYLKKCGVDSHYVTKLSSREMLVRKVEIIPLEVVARRVVAGSLAKRTGLEEGTVLANWLVEFYYKKDELGDPILRDDHIYALGITDKCTLGLLTRQARSVAVTLERLFDFCGLRLVDFKLEFGLTSPGSQPLLADEISPDTCRIWDKGTGKKLDKDVFRFDLGVPMEGYRAILERLQEGIPKYWAQKAKEAEKAKTKWS